jgi:hypothetical protein
MESGAPQDGAKVFSHPRLVGVGCDWFNPSQRDHAEFARRAGHTPWVYPSLCTDRLPAESPLRSKPDCILARVVCWFGVSYAGSLRALLTAAGSRIWYSVGPRCDAAEGWGRAASRPAGSAPAQRRLTGSRDGRQWPRQHPLWVVLHASWPSGTKCSAVLGRSQFRNSVSGKLWASPSCPPAAARSARRWGVPRLAVNLAFRRVGQSCRQTLRLDAYS